MNALDKLHLGLGRRLPVVLQTEAAECGLACLVMIATWFGKPTDLPTLRRRYGLSMKGVQLDDLIGIAEKIGLLCRPLRLELDELRLLKTPCLLHWDMNHFVVLKRVGNGRIVIHDPDVGVRKLSLEQTSSHFTGIAVEFAPSKDFDNAEKPARIRLRSLLGHFVGVYRTLGQLLVLALAIEVFGVMSPLFMQWVVDHALVAADRSLLVTLVVGFAMLLLIHVALTTMRAWMVMAVSASIRVQARSNLFRHLMRLPMPFFESRHLGDVMSRFASQATILRAITTDLIEVVLDGLMVSITLTIMWFYSLSLTLLVLAAAGLYALLRWLSFAPLRQMSAEAIVWGAKRDTHFLESLRGMTTVKLFNAQDERRVQWVNLVVETINRTLATQKITLFMRMANSLLGGFLMIGVVWLGASQVIDGALTVGMLLAFIAWKDQFMTRVGALVDRLVDLQMLRLHGERLADIALSEPEPLLEVDEPRADVLAVNAGKARAPLSLALEDVWFRYADNEPWILKGVSVEIKAGESVAISGPSGCGKTTLLKLLAGLLQPTRGQMIVDGRPLEQFGLKRYRSLLGVVMQDDQLFAGSIADNISFFATDATPASVEQAALLAAIKDDIEAMPMRFHTLVGDMGMTLSGGQKQRLLIARALYRQPRVLLLDEATSHLDAGREKQVNVAIGVLKVTRIVVAHRAETLRSADRVLQLEQGQISQDLRLVDAGVRVSTKP